MGQLWHIWAIYSSQMQTKVEVNISTANRRVTADESARPECSVTPTRYHGTENNVESGDECQRKMNESTHVGTSGAVTTAS